MDANAYFSLIRIYAALALRKRRSYVPAVRALTEARWATIREAVTDPAERERLRMALAVDVARNYGQSDPAFEPTREVALEWLHEGGGR